MPAHNSKWNPKYCDELIEFMGQGYSMQAFAGHIRVGRKTLYRWLEAHEEFADAYEIAKDVNLLFWERLHIENAVTISESDSDGNKSSRTLNTGAWVFAMKNRHGWRDKTSDEIKEEGESRGPIFQVTPEVLELLKKKARTGK